MRSLLPVVLLASLPLAAQEKAPALDPKAAGPALRIWSTAMQDGQEVFFRRRFEMPKGVRSVRIVASCDDICSVAVNGRQMAESDLWEKVIVLDLESLPKGKNVISVRGRNRGGPAALVLWLLWTTADGRRHELVTDQQWRVSEEEQKGWESLAFDDSKWQAATGEHQTPFGGTVYGSVPREYAWVSDLAAAVGAIKQALQIEQALQSVRRARTMKEVLDGLDAIEHAVMRARRQIQKAAPARK
jgi:hypothetical protein